MNEYINNLFDLTDKTVIVTGGKRGIGYEITKSMYKAGCKVVIIDALPVEDFLDEFDEESVLYLQYDLSQPENITESFNKSTNFLNGIDILINNAGINKRFFAEEFPTEIWHEILNINLNAVFQLCKLAGNIMINRGYGKIINLASMLSFTGGYTAAAYAASKGGVAQLTKSLANEWAGKGINVNAIAPGFIITDLNTQIIDDESRYNSILSRIPANRWGTCGDLSGTVLFLSSKASDFINGVILPVDGGYLIR